jgi:hypothetical protein
VGVWTHQWKACKRRDLTSFFSFSAATRHWVDAEILIRFFKKKTLANVSVKIFKNKTLGNVSVKTFNKKNSWELFLLSRSSRRNSWECFFCQDLQEEKLMGMFLLSRSPRRKLLGNVSVSSLILSLFCRGV